jgi:hypothetical protein
LARNADLDGTNYLLRDCAVSLCLGSDKRVARP